MKLLRTLIDKAYKIKFLSKFKPVIDAADAFFFGPEDITPAAPHIRDNLDIKRYMSFVIIAILPATLASLYFYRLDALKIILVSYAAGGLVEVLFAIFRKKVIHEGLLVTGLIFPMILPPTTPLWIVAVGIMFGCFFGKEVFGGTGRNIFNPALVGRLFITIAFPSIMTTSWRLPMSDAITSATPLVLYKTSGIITPYFELLMGSAAGSMGEIFRIGIIIGGLFLIFSKVSNWRIPFTYLGTVLVLSGVGSFFFPVKIAPPIFQILSGGLLFGAMFMATDPVTSPFTTAGKFIFGVGCGIFTVLIRGFSGYVEGVMFSIILMNAFAPLIDQAVIKIKYRPVKK